MLFFYLGLNTMMFEVDGDKNISLRFGLTLNVGWDGEFGGPDFQLWVNLVIISFGIGIETNPYIKRGIESGR